MARRTRGMNSRTSWAAIGTTPRLRDQGAGGCCPASPGRGVGGADLLHRRYSPLGGISGRRDGGSGLLAGGTGRRGGGLLGGTPCPGDAALVLGDVALGSAAGAWGAAPAGGPCGLCGSRLGSGARRSGPPRLRAAACGGARRRRERAGAVSSPDSGPRPPLSLARAVSAQGGPPGPASPVGRPRRAGRGVLQVPGSDRSLAGTKRPSLIGTSGVTFTSSRAPVVGVLPDCRVCSMKGLSSGGAARWPSGSARPRSARPCRPARRRHPLVALGPIWTRPSQPSGRVAELLLLDLAATCWRVPFARAGQCYAGGSRSPLPRTPSCAT
jgi:hypothetical protein